MSENVVNPRAIEGNTYHVHPNGGGLVSETATVDQTAYVGPGCMVSDQVQVLGTACVTNGAHVFGYEVIRDVTITEDSDEYDPSVRFSPAELQEMIDIELSLPRTDTPRTPSKMKVVRRARKRPSGN